MGQIKLFKSQENCNSMKKGLETWNCTNYQEFKWKLSLK